MAFFLPNKKSFALLLAALLLFCSFSGCSASRKLKAASVLQKCRVEILGASLISAEIDASRFATAKTSPLPNAGLVLLVQNIAKGKIPDSLGTLHLEILSQIHNASEDTLWLRSAEGIVHFDSVFAVPVSKKDSAVAISPGNSEIPLAAKIQIGPNLLKILSTDTLRIVGDLEFSLSEDGAPVPFHVDEKRRILPEERAKFVDRAREELLSTIIDIWAAHLQ